MFSGCVKRTLSNIESISDISDIAMKMQSLMSKKCKDCISEKKEKLKGALCDLEDNAFEDTITPYLSDFLYRWIELSILKEFFGETLERQTENFISSNYFSMVEKLSAQNPDTRSIFQDFVNGVEAVLEECFKKAWDTKMNNDSYKMEFEEKLNLVLDSLNKALLEDMPPMKLDNIIPIEPLVQKKEPSMPLLHVPNPPDRPSLQLLPPAPSRPPDRLSLQLFPPAPAHPPQLRLYAPEVQ